jgi:pyridoxal phosphate enzyme (YggS family)
MGSIANNLQEVKRRLSGACSEASRSANSVTLLAVSKTFPAEAVRQAHAAGQRAFGENYVQEALAKIETLADLRPELEWHLIGPLQSNKARGVAAAFDWVHSVDRLKIAEKLAEYRPPDLAPLQICLQVNISGEASKSGLPLDAVLPVAQAVLAWGGTRLRLRGLMSIPEPAQGLVAQRAPHRALFELLGVLRHHGLELDTLSMGMSADLEAAVLEGATILRVGSAIFGSRG